MDSPAPRSATPIWATDRLTPTTQPDGGGAANDRGFFFAYSLDCAFALSYDRAMETHNAETGGKTREMTMPLTEFKKEMGELGRQVARESLILNVTKGGKPWFSVVATDRLGSLTTIEDMLDRQEEERHLSGEDLVLHGDEIEDQRLREKMVGPNDPRTPEDLEGQNSAWGPDGGA